MNPTHFDRTLLTQPPTPMRLQVAPAVAAVVYDHDAPVDALMIDVLAALRKQNIRVAGLLQHTHRPENDERCVIELEDILHGRLHRLTQNLGAASISCSLDITVLAEASGVLRQAIADCAQIVMVNKFGGQEAAGGGLRNEMLQVALAGIPMLTTVSHRHLDDWTTFAGEDSVLLARSVPAVLAWCRNAMAGAETLNTAQPA